MEGLRVREREGNDETDTLKQTQTKIDVNKPMGDTTELFFSFLFPLFHKNIRT